MPRYTAISMPYARSCLKVASATDGQSAWISALDALAAVVQHPGAGRVLNHPLLSSDDVSRFVLDTAGAISALPDQISNLIKLLVENQRLFALPEIAEQFRLLWQAQAKRLRVVAQSAYPLNDSQRQQLCAALSKRMATEVDLDEVVVPELGGGLRLCIGDEIIDGSLLARLSHFARFIARE